MRVAEYYWGGVMDPICYSLACTNSKKKTIHGITPPLESLLESTYVTCDGTLELHLFNSATVQASESLCYSYQPQRGNWMQLNYTIILDISCIKSHLHSLCNIPYTPSVRLCIRASCKFHYPRSHTQYCFMATPHSASLMWRPTALASVQGHY